MASRSVLRREDLQGPLPITFFVTLQSSRRQREVSTSRQDWHVDLADTNYGVKRAIEGTAPSEAQHAPHRQALVLSDVLVLSEYASASRPDGTTRLIRFRHGSRSA